MKSHSFKIGGIFVLIIMLILSLGACDLDEVVDEIDDVDDGEIIEGLIVGTVAGIESLDPHEANDEHSFLVQNQIYDTLIIMNEDMEIEEGLAVDWEKNGTKWNFELREGVEFHNGELFTAQDVKYTLDRMLDVGDPAEAAFILNMVEEINVKGDYELEIITEDPFSPLLRHLAHPVASILNEEAIVNDEVVGTGAYQAEFDKFEDLERDEIILQKNENYWNDNAEKPALIFRTISDDSVRANKLSQGEIDIALSLPADETNLTGVDIIEYQTLSTQYVGFNLQKQPFENQKVRKVLNYGVDVEDIVADVYGDSGEAAEGPLSEEVFASHPNLEDYGYDQREAERLLEEAGYEDGFSTTIWTNDNPIRIEIAEKIKENLEQIDIEVEIKILDWADYLEKTAEGEHEIFILGWVAVTGDADYGLYGLFHSDEQGHYGNNRTFYNNEKVDNLLEEGRKTANDSERRSAYHEAQELIIEDAPKIFIVHTLDMHGIQSNLANFTPHPSGHHDFSSVR